MITQITKGTGGIGDYLKTGKKKDSRLTRDEKDDRVVFTGNLELIEDSINRQQSNSKKGKDKEAYYHISLSFTDDEWQRLYDKGEINNLIEDYLRLTFPNHNLSELLYYAEAHLPIIKEEPFIPRAQTNENNKRLNAAHINSEPLQRKPHIHLIVSLENLEYTAEIRSGGLIYNKNKAVMAKAVEKFKRVVNDILSNKYELNNINPIGLSEDKLKTQWENFQKAAQKVSKGKERNNKMEENSNLQILDSKPSEDPDIKDLLSDSICSTIDNLLKTVEQNAEIKASYYDRGKKFNGLDMSDFLSIINEKYKINAELTDKGKAKVKGFTGSFNLTDLMCKVVYNGRKGAFFHVVNELEQIYNTIQAYKKEAKITLSVTDDFKELKGSTSQKPKYQALNNWKTIQVEPYNIDNVLKSYSAISMAEFANGKREASNIKSIIPTLIYDIDNTEYKEGRSNHQFSIENAISMLQSKGIQGYIYPSASHLLDKKTEKFRLIIPTTKAPKIKEYKNYIQDITKELGLNSIVDKVSNSPSQLYYTPKSGVSIINIKGNVLNNEKVLKDASIKSEIDNLDTNTLNKSLDSVRGHEFKNDPKDTIDKSQFLTRVSYTAISKQIPIKDIMEYFDETTTIQRCQGHQILHNKNGRHLYLPEENTAFLFKENKHYTPYVYMTEKFQEAYEAIKNDNLKASILNKLKIKPEDKTKFLEEVQTNNPNLYSKTIFKIDALTKYWDKITKINYVGMVHNIKKFMKNWNDEKGLIELKSHYKLLDAKVYGSSIKLGYIYIDKNELYANGLPKDFGSKEEILEQKLVKESNPKIKTENKITNKGASHEFGI
ncbi:aminotransferase [Campylobacter suis]|uniref:Large polyvalent protein-associated domain-containing protein n=1 Tax=Campylobacter suis TaxID=2790657 RepID=A0ABM8Q216_9BACT|nr:aminotransferase [Campylobacter suis]CAD7286887.1 hypothetical protein LMG8286_00590 [Campylobacter suis]